MESVSAVYVPGERRASGFIEMQLKCFAPEFPEIRDCFHGTLNLKVENPLLIRHPDHRTKELRWHTKDPNYRAESFDITRIQLMVPTEDLPVPAWIFTSSGSPYRPEGLFHEIITKELKNIKHGDVFKINFHRPIASLV